MDVKRAKGKWMAWLCIAVGLSVIIYSALRLIRGTGGALAFAAGLPLLAYGILMLWAMRRVHS